MHILFTTYGLLLIMALFAFAQWKSVESLLSTDALIKWRFGYARERMCATLQKQSKGLHNAYVKQNASKDEKEVQETDEEDEEESRELLLPDSANEAESTTSKGKRSHLLDASTLFRDKDVSKIDGRGKVAFQILRNLIECLYAKEPFYQKMKEKDPDFAEHFIEWLMQKSKAELEEKRPLKRAKELSVLDLDDESLKEARFKMFNGTQSINDSGTSTHGYYPLYELISVQKKQHLVSLWLAPKPLLYAVFQNEDAVNELCELRMNMYRERRKTKAKDDMKSLDDINKQKLEQFFKNYPSEFIDSQYFDFLTSTTRPPQR